MTATKELTPRSIKSIGDSLREFGYPVKDEEVRETGNRLLAGGAAGSDVIAMFIRGMLIDAGVMEDMA